MRNTLQVELKDTNYESCLIYNFVSYSLSLESHVKERNKFCSNFYGSTFTHKLQLVFILQKLHCLNCLPYIILTKTLYISEKSKKEEDEKVTLSY